MALNMARCEEFRDRPVRQAIATPSTPKPSSTRSIGLRDAGDPAAPAGRPRPQRRPRPVSVRTPSRPSDPRRGGLRRRLRVRTRDVPNPRGYNPSPIQTAETVASNLGEIGIEVDINQQSFGPFLEYTAQGRHDACFLGWYTDNADPDNFMYVLLHPQVEEDELTEGQDWVSFDADGYNTTQRVRLGQHRLHGTRPGSPADLRGGRPRDEYEEAVQLAYDELRGCPRLRRDAPSSPRTVVEDSYTVSSVRSPPSAVRTSIWSA